MNLNSRNCGGHSRTRNGGYLEDVQLNRSNITLNMSGEKDNVITCPQCNELVPRKKFCCECAAPLAIVTQPTASTSKATDSEPHSPVQVSDSAVPSTDESTIGNAKQEVSSNASNKIPLPAVVTSSAPTVTVANVSVVPSGTDQQWSTSTTTTTSYSVVLSQSQSGHDGNAQHSDQPVPPTDSTGNSVVSQPSSPPTTGNGKGSTDSSARNDNDKVT